jgi:hypothetical protein
MAKENSDSRFIQLQLQRVLLRAVSAGMKLLITHIHSTDTGDSSYTIRELKDSRMKTYFNREIESQLEGPFDE